VACLCDLFAGGNEKTFSDATQEGGSNSHQRRSQRCDCREDYFEEGFTFHWGKLGLIRNDTSFDECMPEMS
jgi:hypothetical protein